MNETMYRIKPLAWQTLESLPPKYSASADGLTWTVDTDDAGRWIVYQTDGPSGSWETAGSAMAAVDEWYKKWMAENWLEPIPQPEVTTMDNQFKAGDLATLKSGSVIMTVVGKEGEKVYLAHESSSGDVVRATFPACCLVPVKVAPPAEALSEPKKENG